MEEEEEMAVNGSRRARPCSGGRGSQRGSLGVVGSSEPPTDPGGNLGAGAELPVAAAPDTAPDTEPAAPTRPNPELCRVCSSFPSQAGKCPGKGFFPAAKNILANFWLYFNFGVRGAVAGGGCSLRISPRRKVWGEVLCVVVGSCTSSGIY